MASLNPEQAVIQERLSKQLKLAKESNTVQQAYYEGSILTKNLGISIPPTMADLASVCAWPEIVIDSIDEVMDWRGWYSQDTGVNDSLETMYDQNFMAVEAGQAILDALITGVGFFSVGTGDPLAGEPPVLIKAESPNRVTGTWSPRLRRLTDAMMEIVDETEKVTGFVLYTEAETLTLIGEGAKAEIVDRVPHGLGRVPVCQITNRPRASRPGGRSEITRAVRSLTDSGMRTLLGMEIAREFFGAPQRYALGADKKAFEDKDGNQVSQWTAVMSKMLSIEKDADGDIPTVGSFAAASPVPFTELLKNYAQMLSAATGIPANHFGFGSDNPGSADAIRENNSRRDNRAARRQSQFNLGFAELAHTAMLWAGTPIAPDVVVASNWADPATATPAASADRTQKLVAASVLPPRGDVTYEGLGFSPVDIERITADWDADVAAATASATATAQTLADPFATQSAGVQGTVPGAVVA